ncbi:hypothetical protein E2C01_074814 [Portunus trituberculatus]|uniref:Uncharacterized protein n=1 Tax=Portunus trituberculatus TaxID=210409 RepID=A0A5B7I6U0_PORTR|nr:hypothetical protein [Portunus trituberculatus]
MAEHLNGQHAHPEQPAAARESSLLMDGAASTPGSSGSQSSSKPSRRVSSRPDCTRIGDLCGSVPPPPPTDPSLPAVPSSSDPDLMQFSVLPP